MLGPNIIYLIPIVGAVAVFAIFMPIKTWIDSQRKEREAFYKAETFRRITEASGEGAKEAIELMREESRMERIKQYEGLKLGGLICVAVGIGLTILLRAMSGDARITLVGLIPGLIGVAMLVYVYALAGHWEQGPKD
ncbi:MAG: hypothetical protein ABSG60_09625 [Terracidiphilus sp.]|jgi:Flp pilus assembly pilin Flp